MTFYFSLNDLACVFITWPWGNRHCYAQKKYLFSFLFRLINKYFFLRQKRKQNPVSANG